MLHPRSHSASFTVLMIVLVGATPAGAVFGAPPAPEVRTDGGIRYVSGGVGDFGREQIDRLAGHYSLKLVFAAEDGAYLADVDVMIQDSAGRHVLRTLSKGPWLFVDLEPGSYHVTATHGGRTFERDVRLGESPKVLRFAEWRRTEGAFS